MNFMKDAYVDDYLWGIQFGKIDHDMHTFNFYHGKLKFTFEIGSRSQDSIFF